MKTKLYTWTTDNQSGHNTIIRTSREELRAAILDTIGATDADVADSLRLAPFESDEWTVIYEGWLETEANNQNYYSYDDSHEVEVEALTPRIVVTVEGGLIQNVMADQQVDLLVIDYDVEGCDPDDLNEVPQVGLDSFEPARVLRYNNATRLDSAERVNALFAAIVNPATGK